MSSSGLNLAQNVHAMVQDTLIMVSCMVWTNAASFNSHATPGGIKDPVTTYISFGKGRQEPVESNSLTKIN